MTSASTVGARHRTLRQAVTDQIRDMIRDGQLAPGERLLEDRLAEQLGVSRNPVREAIRALEATGLVTVVPRRGAYVASFDAVEAAELLDLRAVLEAYAARLASKRGTKAQIDQIRETLSRGKEATVDGDLVAAAEAHRDFHLAIEAAAGHTYLSSVVEPLRAQTELVFSMLADQRGVVSWEQHIAIFNAIEAQDELAAGNATRLHMQSVLDDLLSGQHADHGALTPST